MRIAVIELKNAACTPTLEDKEMIHENSKIKMHYKSCSLNEFLNDIAYI